MTINISFCILLALSIHSWGTCQELIKLDQFESDVLSYTPDQRVSDQNYSYGMMILTETKNSTENDPNSFNLADYFNVLSAFLTLQESDEYIQMAYEKFHTADGSCEYILAFEENFMENEKYAPVRERYLEDLKRCQANPADQSSEKTTPNPASSDLVKAISRIKEKDQLYRKQDEGLSQRQKELDLKNQAEIEKLYAKYGTYIGRSLVGEDLEDTMWLVIQHSNTEMMRRYLPVIHQAVVAEELSETPLKMLLDRYYGATQGYQFFGSQGSQIPIVFDERRSNVLDHYDLK